MSRSPRPAVLGLLASKSPAERAEIERKTTAFFAESRRAVAPYVIRDGEPEGDDEPREPLICSPQTLYSMVHGAGEDSPRCGLPGPDGVHCERAAEHGSDSHWGHTESDEIRSWQSPERGRAT